MTTLPTPDAPKSLSDDELEAILARHRDDQSYMRDDQSYMSLATWSFAYQDRERLLDHIAALRPQAPDDKPGEEVEDLAKVVCRNNCAEICSVCREDAVAILAAGYHRQVPAPENSEGGVDQEFMDRLDRGDHLNDDFLRHAVGPDGLTKAERAVATPETPPSGACRERARKLLPCKCGLDYCPNPQHSSHDDDCPAFYRSKLATELQSMVRATPTRDAIRQTIKDALGIGNGWHQYFRVHTEPSLTLQFSAEDAVEKIATAILAQLNGGDQT